MGEAYEDSQVISSQFMDDHLIDEEGSHDANMEDGSSSEEQVAAGQGPSKSKVVRKRKVHCCTRKVLPALMYFL